MDETIQAVAANLRRVRRARNLSLNDVAKQAGIAKGTLAQLELGRGNPTVGTLMSLATNLGVTLAELISGDANPVVHTTRAGEGSLVRDDGLQLRLLHRMTAASIMYEIYDMQVSGGRYESPPHAPAVLEHLLVKNGRIKAGPSDNPVELDERDFLSFSADRPHFYEAITDTVDATLMVVYPVTSTPQ